jgi:hypothetical protein
MPAPTATETAQNQRLVRSPGGEVDLRQTCTLKHINRSANAFICHATTRDNDSPLVLASTNKLKKGVRRHLLSINGNATPVASRCKFMTKGTSLVWL